MSGGRDMYALVICDCVYVRSLIRHSKAQRCVPLRWYTSHHLCVCNVRPLNLWSRSTTWTVLFLLSSPGSHIQLPSAVVTFSSTHILCPHYSVCILQKEFPVRYGCRIFACVYGGGAASTSTSTSCGVYSWRCKCYFQLWIERFCIGIWQGTPTLWVLQPHVWFDEFPPTVRECARWRALLLVLWLPFSAICMILIFIQWTDFPQYSTCSQG